MKNFKRKEYAILWIILLLFFGTFLFVNHIQTNLNEVRIQEINGLKTSNSEWNFFREITLTPITPESDYQVRVDLTPFNFDYSKVNFNGSDIRFCDQNNYDLSYWIEKWNTTDTSTIWVKIPTSGTSTIYMKYGNPLATSESNGTNVFMLFDDFEGTSLDLSLWDIDDDGYSSVSVSGGEVRIFSDAPTSWYQTADFGFHTMWVEHGATYGYHGGGGGATFTPTEDVNFTGELHWVNETWAPYFEEDVYHSNDTDMPIATRPVRFMAHTGWSGFGTHYGCYISSDDDTLGQANRTLRVKGWYDLTGPSEIRLDWVAVGKWSEFDPVSSVGLEYIISEPPEIVISSPLSNEFFGYNAPNFEISIEKPFIKQTWYSINDGVTNHTITSFTGTINQTDWDNILTNQATINFYTNDNWGFEDFAEVTINKDIVAPSSLISFIPYETPNKVIESTTFILSADDGAGSGVSMIRYKINDSSWVVYTGSFDLSGYDPGDYLISYYSIDEVGNTEVENTRLVSLVEEPIVPPAIPGFEIYLLISIICIVSIVLFERRYKSINK